MPPSESTEEIKMNVDNAPIRLPEGYWYYVGTFKTKSFGEALIEHKRTYLSLIVVSEDFSELEILIV